MVTVSLFALLCRASLALDAVALLAGPGGPGEADARQGEDDDGCGGDADGGERETEHQLFGVMDLASDALGTDAPG